VPARIRPAWTARAIPLPIAGAAAAGAAAHALGQRLAALDDDALHGLAAVAGADLLVVLGQGVPWIDGIAYLGRDPAAPALLLPTALAPTVPAAVLERAVLARIGSAAPPVALLPALLERGEPRAALRLVPCGVARSIDRQRLSAWLAGDVRDPDIRGHGEGPYRSAL